MMINDQKVDKHVAYFAKKLNKKGFKDEIMYYDIAFLEYPLKDVLYPDYILLKSVSYPIIRL